jgi:patatin-like phospholipase/acyl hydrolase
LDEVLPGFFSRLTSSIRRAYDSVPARANAFVRAANITCARYDAKSLEDILKTFYGDQTCFNLKKPVFVTAADRISTSPYFFNFIPSKVRENFFLRDVSRATSAAPVFFPAATIKPYEGAPEDKLSLMDGGLSQITQQHIFLLKQSNVMIRHKTLLHAITFSSYLWEQDYLVFLLLRKMLVKC